MRKLLQVPTLAMPGRRGGAAQPRDAGGPVFDEPWQAHGFAIVMSLYRDGKYGWAEWDDYLGHEIQSPGHFGAPADGDAPPGDEAEEDDAGEASDRANYNRWIASCEADGAKYHHHWLAACEKLLDAKGIVTRSELDARVASFAEAERAGPRFKAGARVTVRDVAQAGHTHLPLYLRGKDGVVERDLGLFVFPEAGDGNGGDALQHVYSVRFEARDLWGPEASARHSLNFNLWNYNLDPA